VQSSNLRSSSLRTRTEFHFSSQIEECPRAYFLSPLNTFILPRLIPFAPAALDVVQSGSPIYKILALFCPCQPDGKTPNPCPARRSTPGFLMRKRVRIIWRNIVGLRASCGLCCTNPVRDSSRDSSVVAGMHEQTHKGRSRRTKVLSQSLTGGFYSCPSWNILLQRTAGSEPFMTIDFKGAHYPKALIVHAVFFYVRYAVS
jgi:hypothetical protein